MKRFTSGALTAMFLGALTAGWGCGSGTVGGAGIGSGIGGGGGVVGGGGISGGSGDSGAGTAIPTANPNGQAPVGATVGPTALRRLSRQELMNTLGDLFPTLPAGFGATLDIPDDNSVAMAFSLPGSVSDLEVKRFMDMAEATMTALGTNQPGKQLACGTMDDTTCVRGFVTSFGKRAFRRPLDAAEIDDLMALYSKLRTDAELTYPRIDAVTLLAQAILQAPGFLYHWERGLAPPQMDGKLVKFDNYEMASRLSYFLWNSMPDAALMAAADANGLASPSDVAAQAKRLLDSPRADQTLADFITQWLELGPLATSIKDADAYPTFKAPLLDSMRDETVKFSRDVLRGPAPSFANLLTARYTFVDPALASYYGVTAGAGGRVDLTPTGRMGLLTQGALMAVKGNSYRTSPVRRGKFILNRLLCVDVPPPPPDVAPDLQALDPSKTLREQMAEHRSNPRCAACHDVMDPLGYAFERFDGAGKYRSDDHGQAIDSSGTISLDGATVAFNDAVGLAAALAKSPQARDCFTRQWLRYALGRFEQDADQGAVAHLKTFYASPDFNTRDLIVEITRTLPFSHRAVAEGEGVGP
ncbi:MAG TPA: DUF1592 domain-containing protein [Polyangia bacterium]|nr:DUF1592 domain-containing protein [Polyangia bacterium]